MNDRYAYYSCDNKDAYSDPYIRLMAENALCPGTLTYNGNGKEPLPPVDTTLQQFRPVQTEPPPANDNGNNVEDKPVKKNNWLPWLILGGIAIMATKK